MTTAISRRGFVTLRLSDEQRGIVLRTLKARLDALQAEMTHTDNPEFNIQLKREDNVIQALIEWLDSAVPKRQPKIRRSRPRSRTGKRQR